MTSSTAPRKPIPDATETQVLVSSRRRCCLCLHFDGDSSQKPGQIAHIDRDRSNHSESNLAFLCLPHHDQYDSRTSQSKGITKSELIHAKSALLAHVKDAFGADTVSISITIKGNYEQLTPAQREQLLSRAMEAAKVQREVKVLSSSAGSVIFRLRVSAEDAIRILEAFSTGQLDSAGVMSVAEFTAPLKEVQFSNSFSRYSHGIDKREVARTVVAPESAVYFEGAKQTSPQHAAFGLLLRKVAKTYSLLVLVDHESVVSGVFPIPHDEVPREALSTPYQALVGLVERFGFPIRLDGTSIKLRLGERIALPQEMTDIEVVRFLESRAEEVHDRHDYELVCLIEHGVVHADYRMVHLLFALAKTPYIACLHRLGVRVEGGPRGRIMSKKARDA